MDSYERFLVPDGYEQEKLKERRSISVNELFEKKAQLAIVIRNLVFEFEEGTGVNVESMVYDDVSPNSSIKDVTINLRM